MLKMVKKAATSQRLQIFIQDSSSPIGAGLTGLVFNSASLVWYYFKDGASSAVQVTLATATLGTWTSGGFKEIDATNMPGFYEIGIPDAAISTGTECVMMLKGATNMVATPITIQMNAFDLDSATVTVGTNNDKTGYSLSQAFPTNFSSLAITAGGAVTVGTNSDKTGYSLSQSFPSNFASLAITAGGAMTVGTNGDKTGYSVSALGNDIITAASLNADAVTEIQAGLATSSALSTVGGNVTAIKAKTDNLPAAPAAVGDIPTAVQNGSAVWDAVRASHVTAGTFGQGVASVQGNVTGSTASVVGNVGGNVVGSVGSVSGAVGSVTGNVGGNVTGSVGSVTAGVTVSTNNDKTGYGLAADAVNAAALASDAVTEIQTGLATSLALSSVASNVTAIKAKTDNLPATPASSSDIPSAATIADAVWDELRAGHTTSGSFGQGIASVQGNVTGSVASVTAGVIVTTNNDKSGYSLSQAFPSNFSSLAISGAGKVTVGTNDDKTGYSLSQAFPSNFSALSISVGGAVAATIADKTGFSLTSGANTLIAQAVLAEPLPTSAPTGVCLAKSIALGLFKKSATPTLLTVRNAADDADYFTMALTSSPTADLVTATGKAS